MHRSWRWSLAGLLTLFSFLFMTWLVTRYLPESWLKSADQRLTVGSLAGASVAGLVALWGKTFASAKPTPAESGPAEVPAPTGPSVTIEGSSSGIAAAGDRVRNIQGPEPLRSVPSASPGTGRAGSGGGVRGAGVHINGDNYGIASAGDDTINVQEDR
jgi:hypothetical protein